MVPTKRTMPVHVLENTIAEDRRREWTEAAVKNGIGDRQGDYNVRIAQPDPYSPIHIQLEGPEGVIDHTFEGGLSDSPSITHYFERAIPRPVPLFICVLCDRCIDQFDGSPVSMKLATLSLYGMPEGTGFACEDHRRIWTPVTGYLPEASTAGHAIFRMACSRCGSTMYIEFADSRENLRLRCPSCHHYTSAALPVRS